MPNPRAHPGHALGLALVGLVLAGCGMGVAGDAVRQDLLLGRSAGRYIASVPFIPQADNYCGPASLAMVLGYWGERVDQAEIGRELYLPSVQGTLNLDLEFYARRRGYRAESFRGTLERVKAEIDRGRPLIVFQDPMHLHGHSVRIIAADGCDQDHVSAQADGHRIAHGTGH